MKTIDTRFEAKTPFGPMPSVTEWVEGASRGGLVDPHSEYFRQLSLRMQTHKQCNATIAEMARENVAIFRNGR